MLWNDVPEINFLLQATSIAEHLQHPRQEGKRTRSETSQRAQKSALIQVMFKEAQVFMRRIQAFEKGMWFQKTHIFHVFDVLFKVLPPAQPLIS